MRLSSNKPNEPFDPLIAGRRRSTIPDDFTDSEIDFFAQILESIDNPFLKGRLADLVWNSQKLRKIEFALAAIDSYTKVPLDADTWFSDGKQCWQRAISLSRMIGKAAGDRLDKIESSIIAALKSATTQRGFHSHSLADTLMSSGLARSHATTVAAKLESSAREFDAAGNFQASGRFYNASAKWFRYSDDDEKATDMTVAEAEAFANEADARITSDNPSYGGAAIFLEDAVQIYRSIPRVHRDRHGVDQKIQELRLLINEYGQRALGEMKTFSGTEIDLSESIEQARNSVSGKPVHEALLAFANLHSINVKKLRESAIDGLSRTPFRTFFPTAFKSHDGRVIARKPGLKGSTTSEEDELEIRAEMNLLHYLPLVSLAVQALILPALDVLTLEHRLREVDFIDLARRSPIVPRGREVLFGKALAQGFNRDFATSLHLLTPQIEHMVRFHLKSAGVITTHLDWEGIETENGLSALIDLPETVVIFGEDLTYEIKTLFCDQIGPNLRNNIAHGLLDDQQCYTVDSIYAWWLGLKLVFHTFWNSLDQDSVREEEYQGDENTPG